MALCSCHELILLYSFYFFLSIKSYTNLKKNNIETLFLGESTGNFLYVYASTGID